MTREERVENLHLSTQSMLRGWRNLFQKVLGREHLSPTLMTMLFHISSNQPVSGRAIGEALQLSPSAVSQLIDGLATLGYITRETGTKDRRVTYFGLTPTGSTKVDELEHRRMDYIMSVTSTLTDEELEIMVRLQQKMIDEIKRQQTKQKEVTA